ncbi:MAG: peptide chain release factor aRF-1 [Thermoprotei archaeon]
MPDQQSYDSFDEYKIRKLISELESKEGRGTELISLYIPPKRAISDVARDLREEASTASNIKSKTTRKNVLDAIESILQRLKLFREPPSNGLVIFCGAIPRGGPGTEKMEIYVLEPPLPINIYLYRCDSKFVIEPLKKLVEEKDIYGLIVMDRAEATFAILRGRNVEVLNTITSGIPGKHHAGGQSARRFQRIIEQVAHEFYVRIGEYTTKYFLDKDIKGLIIGGPGPNKYEFYEGEYLHYELRKKVLGLVDIGYTGEEGVRELINRSENLLQQSRLMHEKQVFNNLMLTYVNDYTKVAIGKKEVLEKLDRAKVLIMSEENDDYHLTFTCPNCGFRLETDVQNNQEPKEGRICPKCGTQMDLLSKESLVTYLAETFKNRGTVELMSVQTEEGEQLKNSFGGYAAIIE